MNLILDEFNIPTEKRLRAAYNQLKKRGIPLASNQVNYSLIYRAPEKNGVKAACDELGVTLIAYSPIAQDLYHANLSYNFIQSTHCGLTSSNFVLCDLLQAY